MARKNKQASSRSGWALKAISVAVVSMVSYGSFHALYALGMVPSYKSPLDVAVQRLEEERQAVEKAKKDAPELYTEPVGFYLKPFEEEVERLRKKEGK